jgi:hypothetical protein
MPCCSQLIPEVVKQLSPDERNALSLSCDIITKLTPALIKKHNLTSKEHYLSALESAKQNAKEYMSTMWDVTGIADLDVELRKPFLPFILTVKSVFKMHSFH